jgi:hypothetical protein
MDIREPSAQAEQTNKECKPSERRMPKVLVEVHFCQTPVCNGKNQQSDDEQNEGAGHKCS